MPVSRIGVGLPEKGVFWKRGLFRKVLFLEILENLEILEISENRHTVENKGESDGFPEILENLEILEILEIPSAKRPLSPSPGLDRGRGGYRALVWSWNPWAEL